MYDTITMFGLLAMSLILAARDFLIVTCVLSGLAYVAVAIRGVRTKSVAKIVDGSFIVHPSPLKELLKRIIRTRLKAWAVSQFLVAVIGCFVGSQGLLFSRWQAIGLLILGSLLWVSALFIKRKFAEQVESP